MTSAAALKACCAGAYASDAARWLFGGRLHPGGSALTAELVRALDVGPDATVVDVASGLGTSALELAQATGCRVVGVDLSAENVGEAALAARASGIVDRVRFIHGDAEALPLDDASVDGALCECSFCLFPDKEAAARELVRVLRRGGRLALADVVADRERLPAELARLDAWIACVGGALSLRELAEVLASAGLEIERLEPRDAALAALIEEIESRLRLVLVLQQPASLRDRAEHALELAAAVRAAMADGALGYGIVLARRP